MIIDEDTFEVNKTILLCEQSELKLSYSYIDFSCLYYPYRFKLLNFEFAFK